MMMSIGSYVRRGQRLLRRWTTDPRLRLVLQGTLYLLAGLILSAASLDDAPQPLVLSALCAGLGGWPSLLLALGGGLGYWIFWGNAGLQSLVWVGAGLVVSLSLGGKGLNKRMPLLMPALAGLSVAVSGLMFRLLGAEGGALPMYLLRIALAMGAAQVFQVMLQRRDPVMDWLGCALCVLAMAQVAPIPQLGLGFIAAGALGAVAPLPAAALAGLALDLAQVAPPPMAAVLCLAYLIRLVPRLPRWASYAAPAVMFLLTAAL